MKNYRVRKMVTVAMLASISFVIMFFAFPVVPLFPFMKVDFSEIPILIGAYLLGPGAAVAIAGLRSILHLLATGSDLSQVVGNSASFLAALAYVLPIYYITNRSKADTSRLGLGLVTGTTSMTVLMMLANYTFILPLYMKILNFDLGMSTMKYLVVGVLPFNVIKGIIVSTVFVLVYKKLIPWLILKQGFGNENQIIKK